MYFRGIPGVGRSFLTPETPRTPQTPETFRKGQVFLLLYPIRLFAAGIVALMWSAAVAAQAVPTPEPKPTETPTPPAQTAPAPKAAETSVPSLLEKDSARWHYERALVLNAQEKPGKAIAAIYRAFDRIETRRGELEAAAKTKLNAAELKTLSAIERDAKDKRLEGTQTQNEARVLYREQMEKLVQTALPTAQLDEWFSLKRETAECSYLMAVIQARNGRAADAITALNAVVDADPSLPEHIPARLLLLRSYQQLKAWQRALPHLRQLIKMLDVSDPRAQKAVLALVRASTGQPQNVNPDAALKDGIAAIDDTLFVEPGKFREATLGRKLRDPLVYVELAGIFSDEEEVGEVENTLSEAIRMRGGFFPVAYLGIADLEDTAGQSLEAAGKKKEAIEKYQAALKDYDMAYRQMKELDFAEGSDLDASHLEQLRKKIETLQGTATR